MNLNEYQNQASLTANCPQVAVDCSPTGELGDERTLDLTYLPLYEAIGLGGEAGEVLEVLKKMCRNGAEKALDPDMIEKLKLELGDVLWYLSQIAAWYEITLEEVAEANIKKLEERHGTKV